VFGDCVKRRECLTMRIVSIKLSEEQFELLKEATKHENKNQSDVIRQALNEYFLKHRYKQMPFVTKRIKIYT
jgi:metal-responsive CopG/Arc/MetJ family transcriptional regulator